MFKKIAIYIGLIIVCMPTIFPLFHEGFFTMHDDTQVVRVAQMYTALVDGQFPVRWVADLGYGYGYPLFNFYGPLPYYFGALCMFFGASSLVATKIMFAMGILGAAIGMFLLARKIWGTFPAFFAAVLYQYAPYHAVDIYVRGAVSEFWAIAIVPFILLGIVLLEKTKIDKKHTIKPFLTPILVISLSYSALIMTHNITALIMSVFLGIGIAVCAVFIGWRYVSEKYLVGNIVIKTIVLCASLLLGLGLSAFFWVPAFTETSYTNVRSVIGGGADYPDHFVYLEQFWDSPWGFGGSVQGKADGMSFKVGKIHIVLGIFSLILLFWQLRAKSASKRLIVYSICIVVTTLVAIFMSTRLSQPIWDLIPLFAFIQYPWRFLVFIILGISLLAGGLFTLKRDIFIVLLSILLLITILYVNTKYFVPQKYVLLNPSVYESEEYVKWWVSRISDEYMPPKFTKPESLRSVVIEKFVIGPDIQVLEKRISTDRYKLDYIAGQDSQIHVNVAYFPGWKALLDGLDHPFTIVDNGIVLVAPAGTHQLEIVRRNTANQIIANTISLFSLVAIFGTMMRLKYFHVEKTKG